jgi:serpin B
MTNFCAACAALLTCTLIVTATSEPEQPAAPQDRQAVVQGSNAFAFDLYGRLASKPGNMIYSPYSISAALAMTGAGAKGDTAAQMTKVLHLPTDAQQVAQGYSDLIQNLNGKGRLRQFQLLTANALWPQKGFPFHAAYVSLLQSRFGANAREMDYIQNADQARQIINQWVAEQTKNKIPELFNPGTLTPATRLVLTNTIYFKADWAKAFSKQATHPQDFYLAADKKTPVPMMHCTDHFAYQETPEFQAIELPYKDQDVALLVILPKQKDGLAALEKSLPQKLLTEGLPKGQRPQVAVSLPKFKISGEFTLNSVLTEMGMTLPFSNRADFSGMSEHPLTIDLVIHKAIMEVDEEGTVAAAATGVAMREPAAIPHDRLVEFTADHPFLVVIRDNRTGCILFLGRVMNPQG